eukprot:365800-Chlamydomonas_euryale.AAC.16
MRAAGCTGSTRPEEAALTASLPQHSSLCTCALTVHVVLDREEPLGDEVLEALQSQLALVHEAEVVVGLVDWVLKCTGKRAQRHTRASHRWQQPVTYALLARGQPCQRRPWLRDTTTGARDAARPPWQRLPQRTTVSTQRTDPRHQ